MAAKVIMKKQKNKLLELIVFRLTMKKAEIISKTE
jgi:hypothetical protein